MKFYVRLVLREWNNLAVDIEGCKTEVKVDNSQLRSCGFLEVYSTMEDFKKEYPDEEPFIVESTIKNGKQN